MAGTVTPSLAPDHGTGRPPGHGATGVQAGFASTNWSGYFVTSSAPYTSVTSKWTVPTVTGPNGSYSAAWVGIDGATNNSLIQTGTEQDYSNGTGQYSAWWTTSSQSFAEQVITTGCTTAAAAGPSQAAKQDQTERFAAPGGGKSGSKSGKGGGGSGGGGHSPSATTGSASGVTQTGATLNGTVDPHGTATTYYFEYGTTTSYGSTTAIASAGSGKSSVAVSATLSNLTAGQTYDFQLVASSSTSVAYGGNVTFTTLSSSGSGGTNCGSVAPGDQMSASISETDPSTSTWSIALADTTAGWSFTKSVTYTGPGASAEWILEAPSLCTTHHCSIGTLANYGTAVFDPGTANGVSPGLVSADGIEMVNASGTTVISSPSAPDADSDGFAVAYGATAPSPPSS